MLDVLRGVDLFAGMTPEGVTRLEHQGRYVSFPAGTQLLRQGDVGDFMFILVKGRVRVDRAIPTLLRQPLVLAYLGPGHVVGEMGILDSAPRTATVTAVEDTEALELGAETLSTTLSEFPSVAAAFLRLLSTRFRATVERYESGWIPRAALS